MVFAMQSEGESISKLEKADVLELTVKHLRKLKRQQMLSLNPALDMDRFHAGYTTCATEVSRTLASTGVDISIGSRLMSHLGHKLNNIETSHLAPLTVRVPEARHAKYITALITTPASGACLETFLKKETFENNSLLCDIQQINIFIKLGNNFSL